MKPKPAFLVGILVAVAAPAFSGAGDYLNKIVPLDGATGDGFGASLALSQGKLICGAPNTVDNGLFSGSVYVFDAATETQLLKIVPADGASGLQFGGSLAAEGSTILIGESGYKSAGFAYLFTTTGVQIAKINSPRPFFTNTNPGGLLSGEFGKAVALTAGMAVIGAPGEMDRLGKFQSGAAYVFDTSSGSLYRELIPSDPSDLLLFGSSVATDGNVVLVGALGDRHDGYSCTGSVYVFDVRTGKQLRKFTPDCTNITSFVENRFGSQVAIRGDTAIIAESYTATLYLFSLKTGRKTGEIRVPAGAGGMVVGSFSSFALAGNRLVVGDFGQNAAYLFDFPTRTFLATMKAPILSVRPVFGISVATDGSRAYVGASNDDGTVSGSGAVHSFDAVFQSPSASTVIRNGSGVNAMRFRRITDPVLGGDWTTQVDCSGRQPSLAVLEVYHLPSAGVVLPGGEVLVDVTSQRFLEILAPHFGNTIQVSVPIPPDLNLFGASASAQAVIFGAPQVELTNALDLVLGGI